MVNVLWGFRWSCTPLLGSIIADYTPKAWDGGDLSPGIPGHLLSRRRQMSPGSGWLADRNLASI